jgi:hypothetical protein
LWVGYPKSLRSRLHYLLRRLRSSCLSMKLNKLAECNQLTWAVALILNGELVLI